MKSSSPYTIFPSKAAADALLAKMLSLAGCALDDDLEYRVEVFPSGTAVIKIYDKADGKFIGNL